MTRLERQGAPLADVAYAMRAKNPLYIPRNHGIQAVSEAAEGGDFALFERLNAVLQNPFERQQGADDLAAPPQMHERVLQTFCGT